jgi:CRP/FNR family cyclic AMP-dependent transcriptional regulator
VNDLLGFTEGKPVRALTAGDYLISEGDEPGSLYVLESGALVIEQGGTPFATVDNPGAIFGEMSVILGKPATASVRAAGDVRVRVVDDPIQFLIDEAGAALAILRTTALRLDGLTQYLADLKRQFGGLDQRFDFVDGILDQLVHHQAKPTRTGSARDPE